MGRRLFKELERAYGFDEVAIVPGQVTINPDLTSTKMSVGSFDFDIPIMASAMDGAVSPRFAGLMHEMGGLGVLNAEGLYTRYEDPYSTLEEIISMPQAEATNYLAARLFPAHPGASNRGTGAGNQEERLHLRRFPFTPQNTKRMSPIAVEAGADMVVVQSTVTTARHMSRSYEGLIFADLIKALNVPIMVGNCVHLRSGPGTDGNRH